MSRWGSPLEGHSEEEDNNAVKVKWEITYRPLQHDVVISAVVKVRNSVDDLLQIWLKDEDARYWIPELQPRNVAVVEFSPAQKIKEAHLGLFDGKWRREDAGQKYLVHLWGYVMSSSKYLKFVFDNEFVYPKSTVAPKIKTDSRSQVHKRFRQKR
jgi:hypothetical protein